MKLRTKFEDEDFKFGEVVEADIVSHFNKDELKIYCRAKSGGLHKIVYHSISEFLEEWEDVVGINDTNTPLIKDEKIRKAVRAWGKVNNLYKATVHTTYGGYWYLRAFDNKEQGVDLDISGECPKELFDCSSYTIEELCGSEE